jgi:hypothetical protein
VSVGEANERPGLPGVDGFVDAVTADNVASDAGFPCSDIDDVGVGLGDGDSANGRRGVLLLVKDRFPVDAAISGLPDAAGNCAEVVGIVVANDAGNGDNAAAPEWANEAIVEILPGALSFVVIMLSAPSECSGRCLLLRRGLLLFRGLGRFSFLSVYGSDGKGEKKNRCRQSQVLLPPRLDSGGILNVEGKEGKEKYPPYETCCVVFQGIIR